MVVLVLLIGKCFQIDNMVVTNSHIRRDTPLFLKERIQQTKEVSREWIRPCSRILLQ